MGNPGTWTRGSVLYLDYGEGAEPWHERILLQHVGREDWVVLTPDLDMYVESMAQPWLVEVREGAGRWVLPDDLGGEAGQPVYRFAEADRFVEETKNAWLAARAEAAYKLAERERT